MFYNTCPHGEYSERDRKLCTGCKRDREQAKGDQASCQDCTDYAPVSQMIRTAAGSSICQRCNRRRQKLAADREQLALFGQRGLFT